MLHKVLMENVMKEIHRECRPAFLSVTTALLVYWPSSFYLFSPC